MTKKKLSNSINKRNEKVILIHLRRPRNANDLRYDPFYEFGSFGCTGCHASNLLSEKNQPLLNGARFGFVQGGRDGHKLVLLTPPARAIWHGKRMELKWPQRAVPIMYDFAPVVADYQNYSDFPMLRRQFVNGRRSSDVANFSSAFRSRIQPLDEPVATEVIRVFDKSVENLSAMCFANRYEHAADMNRLTDYDRKSAYLEFRMLAGNLATPKERSKGKSSRCNRRTSRHC